MRRRPNQRYSIIQAAGRWVIYDEFLDGLCCLDDGHRNLLPLEWRSRAGAEAWLQQCRIAWLAGLAPEPEGAGARIVEGPPDGSGERRSYWI